MLKTKGRPKSKNIEDRRAWPTGPKNRLNKDKILARMKIRPFLEEDILLYGKQKLKYNRSGK